MPQKRLRITFINYKYLEAAYFTHWNGTDVFEINYQGIMSSITLRIKISNNHPSFITLSLEPWGEDYGMFPNDEFEIIAEDADETCYFHIVYEDKVIFVYAEGKANYYPRVYQNGEELDCGHNRQEDF